MPEYVIIKVFVHACACTCTCMFSSQLFLLILYIYALQIWFIYTPNINFVVFCLHCTCMFRVGEEMYELGQK